MADRNSIIDKIKALLSKTTENGCTEEEMLSALAKARAWIDAHEVSDDELQLSRQEKATLRSESEADARDTHRIKWHIAVAVGRYCNVTAFRNSSKTGLSFVGFNSDIDWATWLLNHLADFVHDELFKHLLDCLAPDGQERKEEIRGFVVGCCERIDHRLIKMCDQSKTARTASGNALVVIKDQAIKDFLKAEDIRLRSGCGSRARLSDSARAAGRSAGDRASFGRPVSGNGAALRLGKN